MRITIFHYHLYLIYICQHYLAGSKRCFSASSTILLTVQPFNIFPSMYGGVTIVLSKKDEKNTEHNKNEFLKLNYYDMNETEEKITFQYKDDVSNG